MTFKKIYYGVLIIILLWGFKKYYYGVLIKSQLLAFLNKLWIICIYIF